MAEQTSAERFEQIKARRAQYRREIDRTGLADADDLDWLIAKVEELYDLAARLDTNLNFGALYAKACEENSALRQRIAELEGR